MLCCLPSHDIVSLKLQVSTLKPKLFSVNNRASHTILQTLTLRGKCLGSFCSVCSISNSLHRETDRMTAKHTEDYSGLQTMRGECASETTSLCFSEYEQFST